MKKILLLAFTLALAVGAFAQVPSVPVKKRSSLPATCSPDVTLQLLVYKTGANSGLYYCSATDTWTQVASDGTFSGAISGTRLTAAQGTITTSQPYINHTATWNNAGQAFQGIVSDVTQTANANTSKYINLKANGSTVFYVDYQGYSYAGQSHVGGSTVGGGTNGLLRVKDSADNVVFGVVAGTSSINFSRTVTAGGTTGNQTINKPVGTVNFAAGASAITVTNSTVTTSSIIFPVIRTADATCTSVKSVVPGSGSFVITLNATCTAEASVGFMVTN